MRRTLRSPRPLRAMLLTVLIGSCMAPGATQTHRGEPGNLQAVSSVPPPIAPLARQAPPLLNRPLLASRGSCAPRYANGLIGSCVNNQPCRGFAVAAPGGGVECACARRRSPGATSQTCWNSPSARTG
jgi:hypothetical protein